MWVRADLPDPAIGTALLLLMQAGTLLLTSLYKSPSHPGQGREAVTMVIFTLANYRHQNSARYNYNRAPYKGRKGKKMADSLEKRQGYAEMSLDLMVPGKPRIH